FRFATDIGKMAHNSYLSVLVETGIPGFILFAITWIMAINFALRHPKQAKRFWLTLMMVLAIGIFSLNWAHRKQTWLVPGLIATSAALISHQTIPESSRYKWSPTHSAEMVTTSSD
ncbi:MAG: hypothetical protein JSV68_04555, partial [Anaerolineaceae bacterium]